MPEEKNPANRYTKRIFDREKIDWYRIDKIVLRLTMNYCTIASGGPLVINR